MWQFERPSWAGLSLRASVLATRRTSSVHAFIPTDRGNIKITLMLKLSFEYWNALASQFAVISSLLAGFCLSLIFSLPETNSKITNYVFRAAVTGTASFLISIFAMTKILLLTTKGYPFKVTEDDFLFPRISGVMGFFVGILSIVVILSLSGQVKSENSKRFTTIAGIITLVLIIALIT